VIAHHPAVARYHPPARPAPPEYFTEFGGAITPHAWTIIKSPDAALPPFDEEYFEWVDLLEAIEAARGRFVFVELGAGYGRWSVRAALAARAAALDAHCVAVEAEPTHARWMRQHFTDNGIPPETATLLWAAVAPEQGVVPFEFGKPSRNYARRVARKAKMPPPSSEDLEQLFTDAAACSPPVVPADAIGRMWVPAVTLPAILSGHPTVDLIDIDVQGTEAEVLTAAASALDSRVRRVHIGTHGPQIEADLRVLFGELGWTKVIDYPSGTPSETPYGEIRFSDGVQTWINPRV
jgi:FkbM family methyltransferase